jgi:hypothetical protein
LAPSPALPPQRIRILVDAMDFSILSAQLQA